MLKKIQHYFSLVKFSHTIFAMPFAFIGFSLALFWFFQDNQWTFFSDINPTFPTAESEHIVFWSSETGFLFLKVVLCMVFARSAAMAFNRWLDKNFDAKNPRTAIREIPAGIISANQALLFVLINSIAFVVTTWFINPLCFALSFVALFVILFYSFTKRFTPLCHLVLGLGLSLAPIGAFLAVTGFFHWLPLLFSLTVFCWVAGFDIIYALQDEEFDRAHQLNSIPVWLGKTNALKFSRFLHFISFATVFVAGWMAPFGTLYWIGAVVFSGMLIFQQSIVKPNDLSRVNLAFMTANGVASVIFSIFVIADLFF